MAMANQYRYNIRVISNSYGNGNVFNPNNPLNVASKMAYDRNITVLFSNSNDGPTKNTMNDYAQAPWVIGVAAELKKANWLVFRHAVFRAKSA
jgi:serine protease AprX